MRPSGAISFQRRGYWSRFITLSLRSPLCCSCLHTYITSFQHDHWLPSEDCTGPGRALRQGEACCKDSGWQQASINTTWLYCNAGNCLLHFFSSSFSLVTISPAFLPASYFYLGRSYHHPMLVGFVQQSFLLFYIEEWPKPYVIH